jgi:hypothetical protein
MNIISFDNIILDPKSYVKSIHSGIFIDVPDGDKFFKNIQPRNHDDEFALFVKDLFPDYEINHNFVRKSPYNQEEPNFIHKDDMMGDMTCILYLNEHKPLGDGTTIYDEDNNPICVLYSKFNRMIVFNADALHSRNIYENFGEGEHSRLIQVIFLKRNNDK